MRKILYLECFSGISGDMTVGALLDLGLDVRGLQSTLDSLEVSGFHITTERVKKCGIDAFSFDVILEESGEHHHIEKRGEHEHHHTEESSMHEHYHHTEENSEHHHHHEHRNLQDIEKILERLKDERVHKLALKMFKIVAEAEAQAHGIPMEEVHFHEVGAIDSIVDIVSVAYLITELSVDEVIISKLYEGQGQIRCAHGVLPVPVPATLNISSKYHLPLYITDTYGEMITPTGAAIAAALRTKSKLPESYQIVKIGIGSGKRDYGHANILRAMLLETDDVKESEKKSEADDTTKKAELLEESKETEKNTENTENAESKENTEQVYKLESNIDDCSGEMLGYAMEQLFTNGALDVWYTPIYMKKNRPAYQLNVLCAENQIEEMEQIIFVHTTTIGIRKIPVERTTLKRELRNVKTLYGEAKVKCCNYGEKTFFYPEYESVKKLCEKAKTDYMTVYHEVVACADKKEKH